jgi:hypothetical protein
MAGPVRERRRRAQDAVALRVQRGQAQGHLARETFDAADLGADGGPGVDEDRVAQRERAARRSTNPEPSIPPPSSTATHAFSPVYGSVLPEGSLAVLVEPLAAVVAVALVVPEVDGVLPAVVALELGAVLGVLEELELEPLEWWEW